MAKDKKPEKTIVALLRDAGFKTVAPQNDRVIHASGTEDFGKSHATFLKASCKHPALIGCSRFESTPAPILIVHQREPETTEHDA